MSAFYSREFETLAYQGGGTSLDLFPARQPGSTVARGSPADRPSKAAPTANASRAAKVDRAIQAERAALAERALLADRDREQRHSFDGALAPHAALLKRAFDIAGATIGLILLALPMLFIAALIRLTSKGPALFMQERIGLHGERFVMLKFRTMRDEPERPGFCRQATRDDPRVTRIGALLRRTSFDELPQLLNVLGGTMSLVGPRPHAPGTCAGGRPFEVVTHRYADRHAAKPGMTGLAQVRGWRGETDTEEKLLRRIDSDLEYIATWRPSGDLVILLRTMLMMVRRPNAY